MQCAYLFLVLCIYVYKIKIEPNFHSFAASIPVRRAHFRPMRIPSHQSTVASDDGNDRDCDQGSLTVYSNKTRWRCCRRCRSSDSSGSVCFRRASMTVATRSLRPTRRCSRSRSRSIGSRCSIQPDFSTSACFNHFAHSATHRVES